MAKENMSKEHPVAEALSKLRQEETELQMKLKPIQEAISALEKIVDKSVKKVKATTKNADAESDVAEEVFQEVA